eukprot:scaffold4428_cov77-Skeletonema_dohrnii-CCMP3373.AAC.4
MARCASSMEPRSNARMRGAPIMPSGGEFAFGMERSAPRRSAVGRDAPSMRRREGCALDMEPRLCRRRGVVRRGVRSKLRREGCV